MGERIKSTFVITAGPSDVGSGADWYVSEQTDDGRDSVASGGTPRGPRDSDNPRAWMAWARRQVGRVGKWTIHWADAEVRPAGFSTGAGHAPNGVEIRVPASRPYPGHTSTW